MGRMVLGLQELLEQDLETICTDLDAEFGAAGIDPLVVDRRRVLDHRAFRRYEGIGR